MARKSKRTSALSQVLLASVATIGSANAQEADRVIVFGDSLSDGGYFAAIGAAQPPAGSFTTNPDPVAPEVFADRIGLGVTTAYQPGYVPGSVPTGGFNYAVGGARVEQLNPLSPLAVPIATQIDSFLAADRSFGPNDLVYIQGGGNDLFNFATPSSPAFGDQAVFNQAGINLADEVARIDRLGAGTIVTLNVQNRTGNAALDEYNQAFEARLAANDSNVLFFDNDALFAEIAADATQNDGAFFGITDLTTPACTGSSLGCTRADLTSPDADLTNLLADAVHPAGRTQAIQGSAIAATMRAPYQIGGLALAAESLFRGQREYGAAAFAERQETIADDAGPVVAFGSIGYDGFRQDGAFDDSEVDQDAVSAAIGVNYAATPDLSLGGYAALSSGNGDLGSMGDFDFIAGSLTGYAEGRIDRVFFGASMTGGLISYDDITRRVELGNGVRSQSGSTEGGYFGAEADTGVDLAGLAGLSVGPQVGLTYSHLSLDGYSDGPGSTGITYSDQDLDAFTARVGLGARGRVGNALEMKARISYEHLFASDRDLTITPNGAPVSFTRNFAGEDDGFFSYDLGVAKQFGERLTVTGSVSGFGFRDDGDAVSARFGAIMTF